MSAAATTAIDASGSVTARDVVTKATVDLGRGEPARSLAATAASIAFDRNAQTLRVAELATETAGVHAAWTLAGSALLDNPTIEGTVNVTQAPLATVFEQLDWQPPQGVQAGELGDLTLQTEFSFRAEPREIRVSKLSAEVFGMQVSGDGTLTGADELAGNVTIAEFTPSSARAIAAARERAAEGRRERPRQAGARNALRREPHVRARVAREPQGHGVRRRDQRQSRGAAGRATATCSAARCPPRASRPTRSRRRSRRCCRRRST